MPNVLHMVSTPIRRFRSSGPRSDRLELMDAPVDDPAELAANFRDIERVNRLLGGTATVLHHLPRLLPSAPDRPITVLDLATGSADIPLAVVRWAKSRGITIRVIASDASAEILDVARNRTSETPEISLAEFDARNVALPDHEVDIVLCSLALHHFDPPDAAQVLREMHRLGRQGFILNDLRRDRLGYASAWLASRVTTRNRLTRHDAPLSVHRAYTPAELRDLLNQAGVTGATITTHPWFRMAVVFQRGAHA